MKKLLSTVFVLCLGAIAVTSCQKDDGSKGSANGHDYVDLGLSVRWATCNVGATHPVDYGDYYAWGETETKDCYDENTYKYGDGGCSTLSKYCTNSEYGIVDNKTTLDPDDDVAHVKWGDQWRIPSSDEIDELLNYCSWTWIAQGDSNGYEVTGPNGNSIFLPAVGYRSGTTFCRTDMFGFYWSGSLDSVTPCYSYYIYFSKDFRIHDNFTRYSGLPVRPVLPK